MDENLEKKIIENAQFVPDGLSLDDLIKEQSKGIHVIIVGAGHVGKSVIDRAEWIARQASEKPVLYLSVENLHIDEKTGSLQDLIAEEHRKITAEVMMLKAYNDDVLADLKQPFKPFHETLPRRGKLKGYMKNNKGKKKR